MSRVVHFAFVLATIAAYAESPTPTSQPVNGIAALRNANRIVVNGLASRYWVVPEPDHFGYGNHPKSSFGKNVTPQDLQATLRSSSLFERLTFRADVKIVQTDPNIEVETDPFWQKLYGPREPERPPLMIIATVRWASKDLGYYRTRGERDILVQQSEARDQWLSAQRYYYNDYYYGRSYNYGSYTSDYSRALRARDRHIAQVNTEINERAAQRKDYAETVELHLSYSGPLTAEQILDKRKIDVIVQATDVDLRPGLRDVEVGPGVGIIRGTLLEVQQPVSEIERKFKNQLRELGERR